MISIVNYPWITFRNWGWDGRCCNVTVIVSRMEWRLFPSSVNTIRGETCGENFAPTTFLGVLCLLCLWRMVSRCFVNIRRCHWKLCVKQWHLDFPPTSKPRKNLRSETPSFTHECSTRNIRWNSIQISQAARAARSFLRWLIGAACWGLRDSPCAFCDPFIQSRLFVKRNCTVRLAQQCYNETRV